MRDTYAVNEGPWLINHKELEKAKVFFTKHFPLYLCYNVKFLLLAQTN